MTIDEVYRWLNFVANKYQSGAISPDEFNLGAKVVNLELFKLKYGLPEEYQPGAPYPRQAWQITQKITDDMRLHIVPVEIPKSGLYFPLPADYGAFSSLCYLYIKNQDCDGPKTRPVDIDVLTDGEFNTTKGNSIIFPSSAHPKARYISTPISSGRAAQLEVLPTTVQTIDLTYLKLPLTPLRAYTIVGDEDVYNAPGSTQLDWPQVLHPDFAIMMGKYYGINVRDSDLAQFSAQRQASGQ